MHGPGLHHVGVAIATGDQQLAFESDGSTRERAGLGKALGFLLLLARTRIETGEQTRVGHQVHIIAI